MFAGIDWFWIFVIFVFGMAVMLTGIKLSEKLKDYISHRRYKRNSVIKAENDGWVYIGGSEDTKNMWGNSADMNEWKSKVNKEMELYNWIEENTSSKFKISYVGGEKYVRFENDDDNMAFKLRWR